MFSYFWKIFCLSLRKSPHGSSNKDRNCLLLLLPPCCFQKQSINSHWAVCHWQTSVSSCCQWKLSANGAFWNHCSTIGILSKLCWVCCMLTFLSHMHSSVELKWYKYMCRGDMLMTRSVPNLPSFTVMKKRGGLGSRGDSGKVNIFEGEWRREHRKDSGWPFL